MRNVFATTWMALACLSAAASAGAQAPAAGPAPVAGPAANGVPPRPNPIGKPLLYADFKSPAVTVKYPGNVEASFDNVYSSLPGFRPLVLDVYRMPNAGPKPAIIFVHGGSYIGGNLRTDHDPMFGEMDGFMAYVAARGYVVIPVDYRLADEARWPAQLEDVKAAIRWVRTNAARLGVDPQHIGIWGNSAGGHIVAMAGVTCDVAEFEVQENLKGVARAGGGTTMNTAPTPAPQSSCVQAVVDWYGASDFARLDAQAEPYTRLFHNKPDSSQSRVLGCSLGESCDAATVMKTNALHYVEAGGARNVSFLFQVGDRDEAIPWKQSQILHDALRAKGVPSRIETVSGANHYFTGATKEQLKQVLDSFFGFWDETLAKPSAKTGSGQ